MTIDYHQWTCECCGARFNEKIWPYLIDGKGHEYCEMCFRQHAGVNVIGYVHPEMKVKE